MGLKSSLQKFSKEQDAVFGLEGRAMALIGGVVAVIVILTILGATFTDMTGEVKSINENLTNADLGNTSANTIAGVFPILVGVAFVLGVVGVVIAAVKFRRS